MDEQQPEQWAIIELMGRSKIAGRYFEENGLHRIDVPANDEMGSQEFRLTKKYGNGAIFCITPVDEKSARLAAKMFRLPSVAIWSIDSEIERLTEIAREQSKPLHLEQGGDEDYNDYDDDEVF